VAESEDLQLTAWRAVRRTYTTVVRGLDAELEQRSGLALRAYEVLLLLSRAPSGCSRMSDLAANVLLSPSGLTRLVDQLVSRGFIERRQDRSDARAQLAVLTAAGRGACRKATGVYRRSVMEHFGERLHESQLAAIVEALNAFVGEGQLPSAPQSNAARTR
jgi:DNA-binding MarR family transcriptional regulator